ncbi:hypothetical protein QNH10_01240 [Sporosarcina thermotolerans]|uniref:hypothetical protein n=1 Tax=Sporosarcina thermotolerans TaxID=633404 RepID=UPI0024BCF2F5|nr:hypothetical protein [Sporosarcina thermotolerans]WHT48496.1 hypothetical protein QNH10_01240 [Sporosarcina thermotolerans]
MAIEYTGIWSGDFEMMQADNMAFGTYQFMRNLKSVYEGKDDLRSVFGEVGLAFCIGRIQAAFLG